MSMAPGVAGGTRRTALPKPREEWIRVPNLIDYEWACAHFSWVGARGELDGLPGGRGLNIAHEAIDRHAAGPLRNHSALRWLSRDGARRDYTYEDLRSATNRFANVLARLGIRQGDRVAVLAGRTPESWIAALGALKTRAVFTPLDSGWGSQPIRSCLQRAGARVLVTTDALYRRKIEPFRAGLPSLEHVLLVGSQTGAARVGMRHLDSMLAEADDSFDIPPTNPEDPALIHFTGGTTGELRGTVHVHQAVVAHHATARSALDLHADDVFWCTVDPDRITGTACGIIAPLTHGVTSVLDEAEFDAGRWYSILASERVSVCYTAPAAVRMLMKAGLQAARQRRTPCLRFLASGGPLNPGAVWWAVSALGRPIHDSWSQTEAGGIMIANLAAMEVRPGSPGRPLPGVDACIVRRIGEEGVEIIEKPDAPGELALRPDCPSFFRGYLSDEASYRRRFAGGYFLTGEGARRDRDGYIWLRGRV